MLISINHIFFKKGELKMTFNLNGITLNGKAIDEIVVENTSQEVQEYIWNEQKKMVSTTYRKPRLEKKNDNEEHMNGETKKIDPDIYQLKKISPEIAKCCQNGVDQIPLTKYNNFERIIIILICYNEDMTYRKIKEKLEFHSINLSENRIYQIIREIKFRYPMMYNYIIASEKIRENSTKPVDKFYLPTEFALIFDPENDIKAFINGESWQKCINDINTICGFENVIKEYEDKNHIFDSSDKTINVNDIIENDNEDNNIEENDNIERNDDINDIVDSTEETNTDDIINENNNIESDIIEEKNNVTKEKRNINININKINININFKK